MGTMTRLQFNKMLYDNLRKVYDNTYKNLPTFYTDLFNIETSTHYQEEDSGITGIPVMPEAVDGEGLQYFSVEPTYETLYTHLLYRMGMRIGKTLLEDERYGKIKVTPKLMAQAAHDTVEIVAANVFNNIVSATHLGGDGKALASTTHPLYGSDQTGNTFSNLLTQAAMSETSLNEMFLNMEEIVDDNGIPKMFTVKKILVKPAQVPGLEVFLKTAQKPGSMDNDNNMNSKYSGIKIIANPFITSTTGYTCLGDQTFLNFFWRIKPNATPESEADFDTDDLKFKSRMRFSVGWSNPRGVNHNVGA